MPGVVFTCRVSLVWLSSICRFSCATARSCSSAWSLCGRVYWSQRNDMANWKKALWGKEKSVSVHHFNDLMSNSLQCTFLWLYSTVHIWCTFTSVHLIEWGLEWTWHIADCWWQLLCHTYSMHVVLCYSMKLCAILWKILWLKNGLKKLCLTSTSSSVISSQLWQTMTKIEIEAGRNEQQ